MIEELIALLVDTISKFGYLGIIIGMAIESSFIPFPSEIIMIPAGYLAFKGEMNIYLAIFCGILGTLIGAIINYVLAKKIGKPLIMKYGKYFLISQKTFLKTEDFFIKHGEISTFTGRLLPGIRQLISIPAGAFGMNFPKFLILTALGGGIWITILAVFGFAIGHNQNLIKEYYTYIKFGSIAFAFGVVLLYIIIRKYKSSKNT